MKIIKVKNVKVRKWQALGSQIDIYTEKEPRYIVEITEKELLLLLPYLKGE